MSDEYAVFVEGLQELDLLALEPQIERRAMMAINKTAEWARVRTKDELKRKYNFPGNYLDPRTGRLEVSKKAVTSDLEAVIKARSRATSLTRFMVGHSPLKGKGGIGDVSVSIIKGKTKTIKKAILLRLNNNNVGFAIRTKDGMKPGPRGDSKGAYAPKQMRNGLWLLYGPSVDQAFRFTRDLTATQAEVYLADEFTRLQEAGI